MNQGEQDQLGLILVAQAVTLAELLRQDAKSHGSSKFGPAGHPYLPEAMKLIEDCRAPVFEFLRQTVQKQH
jgi:hypothetical protein